MDISKLLGGGLGNKVITGISQRLNMEESETSSVVNAATPVILGMLKSNASSEGGAGSLLNALNQHNGNILDNISDFFNQQETSEGKDILAHILGDKQTAVENQISRQTGVSKGKINNVMALLAPIIMGQIGKKVNLENISSGQGINELLGNIIEGSDGGNILGSIMDSVTGNKNKSGKGLGDMLGGILGKK